MAEGPSLTPKRTIDRVEIPQRSIPSCVILFIPEARELLGEVLITLLGGAAAWLLEGERMRRIGVLLNLAADDPDPRSAL